MAVQHRGVDGASVVGGGDNSEWNIVKAEIGIGGNFDPRFHLTIS